MKAFTIPGIIEFSLSHLLIKLVSNGLYYWYPTFLMEQVGYNKTEELDLFKMFSTGSFFGNLVLGVISDLVPMRSLVYEFGIMLSTILMFVVAGLTHGDGYFYASAVSFLLGASLTGASIVIIAIECDMGNYVRKKYN